MNSLVKQYLSATDQEQQLLVLYRLFKTYDLDGNNQIDRKEVIPLFMDFLKELGMDPAQITSNDVKQFIKGIDTDQNGAIDFIEFEKWFREAVSVLSDSKKSAAAPSKKKLSSKTLLDEYLTEKDAKKQLAILQRIFNKYDLNEDGQIDRNEFKQFLTDLFTQFELGVPSKENLLYFFDTIDVDKSGTINLQEIEKWFKENIEKFTQ
ncbi:hypothetical protein C9374_014385 [Naegleria lovaniensis]|uniref:EF-hand domain-containing protein n=1 Tax=Naegleria lovaniensis TaxID=51637 RepID=A0AA88GU91_NAELO|nr:uncharacterized protein C9374_014385 [Naegleria lovaniensis]KAG2388985.1 hypothetical protein C9374_014385 [Naegleria lovaniensis]